MAFHTVKFEIFRMNDRRVFDAITKGLAGEFPVAGCKCSLIFGGDDVAGLPGQDAALDRLLEQETIAIGNFQFSFATGIRVDVNRQWDSQKSTFTSGHDVVTVQPGQGVTDSAQYAKLLRLLRSELHAVDDKLLLDFLKDEDRAFFEARERSIRDLQQMQEDFFRKLQDFTTHQAERYQAKQDELEGRYAEKELHLAENQEKRSGELDERENALKRRSQELDDRAATHARRQHYKDIIEKFKSWSEDFHLTKGTQRLRWHVYVPTVILLVLFGGLGGWFLFRSLTAQETTELIASVTAKVAFVLLFVSTALFLIRWNNQWFQRHANEEFRHKRMELDVVRASWFVEMAFEWKEEKGEAIPLELIERLTQGLFTQEASDHDTEPADSLAQALVGAAKFKVKLTDGTEVEYDRRGVRDLLRGRR